MDFHRPRRALVAATACLALVLLSSCADPGTGDDAAGAAPGDPPAVQVDPAVARLVPADVRSRGRIVFATNAPNPPIAFFKQDNKTLTGFTIDLGNALAATMGVGIEWRNTSFDSTIPGLAAGRYDGAMSSYSIEHDRLSTADFVSYYLSGGGFLIKRGSGIKVNSFDGLCGYRVSVKKGTSQIGAIADAGRTCATRGKRPIETLQVPTTDDVLLTLQSGRADVAVIDKPQAVYAQDRSNGQFCVSSVYQTAHSIAGIAVPKGSKLAEPLRAAVDSLLRSGAYDRISEMWGAQVTEAGTPLSAEYQKIAAPWGVGPDGRIVRSRVFTDPKQIEPGDSYYYQPVLEGCE